MDALKIIAGVLLVVLGFGVLMGIIAAMKVLGYLLGWLLFFIAIVVGVYHYVKSPKS
jgi:hypothetical protein